MNEEQNSPGKEIENVETNDKAIPARDNTSQPPSASGSDDAPQDDYYAVDYAKKEVITTIGDGEMHNEGLVGKGDVSTEFVIAPNELTDEQGAAEPGDSKG